MEQPASDRRRAIIVAGGEITSSIRTTSGDYVIAADSGFDLARAQSINPDLLIGDLDSISKEGLRHAESIGARIDRFPGAKDKTDFELAMAAAIAWGASAIDIYGGESGSIGHLFGISTALTARAWSRVDLRWFVGNTTVFPVQPNRTLKISPTVGTTLTLIPVGDAENVTMSGVRWPLSLETLPRGTSRGLSNITTDTTCTVSLTDGALLVIVEEGSNT